MANTIWQANAAATTADTQLGRLQVLSTRLAGAVLSGDWAGKTIAKTVIATVRSKVGEPIAVGRSATGRTCPSDLGGASDGWFGGVVCGR
jgi:hypothetical protein